MSLFKRLVRIARSEIQSRTSPYTSSESPETSWTPPAGGIHVDDPMPPGPKTLEDAYLANLELKPGATLEDVRNAHKRLLKKYHPDFYNNNETKRQIAEDIVQQLNKARDHFENKYKG